MRLRALAAALLLLPLAGCLDILGGGRDHAVSRTPLDAEGWNRIGVFSVQVREPDAVHVEITATATDGRLLREAGESNAVLPPVELAIPDGTWTIKYSVAGETYETFKRIRFDGTPPRVTGLGSVGDAAADGTFTLGQGAVVEPGASVQVIEQGTGRVVASALPTRLTGLTPASACGGADGCIRAYDVVATDQAGNEAVEQVQVRIGDAQEMPAGANTLGLVARYTQDVLVWDIHDLGSWITPAQARAAVANDWLGAGRAIEPEHEAVQAVVRDQVTAAMTVGEAALQLFKWMADELEYDTARLEAHTLLRPHQVILDQEDASAAADADEDGDGFVPDGSGNGVAGGVCRDLAALYVSLLRAAGIPARLVTGYLGGEVNGFHAWVEFYGGDGHGPSAWVPVDVSGIGSTSQAGEQRYEPGLALQAFGLRHTDMLPLRTITEAQEDGMWSTAVALSTQYPASQRPQVDLAKDLTPQFTALGTLCVDQQTLEREVIGSRDIDDCPLPAGVRDFVRSASYVLDYGADVRTAASGTTVTVTLAYPEPAAVAPGSVEQVTYCTPGSASADCEPFERDASRGVTVGVWGA